MRLGIGLPACSMAVALNFLSHQGSGAFLEKLETPSYVERVHSIRAASPERIILPEGWLAFVTEKERGMDWNEGKTFFLYGQTVVLSHGSSMRERLGNLFGQLGLSWKFDSKEKVIRADFPWRRADAQSNRVLLQLLFITRPAGNTFSSDAWNLAFNALLSKPENFARVWRLRFCADDRAFSAGLGKVENLVSGPISDRDGHTYSLIVNDQGEIRNPGPPGSISYYLFDEDGRFERGGIYSLGYRCFADSAWIGSDGRTLHVQTYNNGSEKRESVFVLENRDLRRTAFFEDGVERNGSQWKNEAGTLIFSSRM